VNHLEFACDEFPTVSDDVSKSVIQSIRLKKDM